MIGALIGLLLFWALAATFVAACAIWAVIVKVKSGGQLVREIMREFLDDLPPEARARAEALIGQRGGM